MSATKLDIREVYPLKHGRPSRLEQAVRALVEVALTQDDPVDFIAEAADQLDKTIKRLVN